MSMTYEEQQLGYIRAEAKGNATKIMKDIARNSYNRHIERLARPIKNISKNINV